MILFHKAMDSETIEDFLDFKCPYCGALNSFPGSAANHARECVNCLETFLVPDTDGAAARTLPLPFETGHLLVRRFEPGDWQDLLEFAFDDEDTATGWLLTVSRARLTEAGQPYPLAIVKRDVNKVIGTLNLMFMGIELDQLELAVNGREDESLSNWKLEALDGALKFCFRELKAHRVCAQCDGQDSESRNLFKDLGMRQEAEFLKNHRNLQEWRTTVWFAMLEAEFFANAGGR